MGFKHTEKGYYSEEENKRESGRGKIEEGK
jgi:hypothetical protein